MSPDEAKPMRTTEVVRLVAGREIGERLRTKSFYALTGLLVAAILALGVLSQLAGDDGPDALDVGVTGPAVTELELSIVQTADVFERGAEVTGFDQQTLAILQQAWSTVDVQRSLSDAG